jgi:hypothetical protein
VIAKVEVYQAVGQFFYNLSHFDSFCKGGRWTEEGPLKFLPNIGCQRAK